MIATVDSGAAALAEPKSPTEFLICGAKASAVKAAMGSLDLEIFDPSGLHARIREANGLSPGAAGEDLRRLRVPIVPPSLWTRLSQVVSRERSGSTQWAVVSEDLALFVPLWKHLMPAAHIVSFAHDPAAKVAEDRERGLAEVAFRVQSPSSCSLISAYEASPEGLARVVEQLL